MGFSYTAEESKITELGGVKLSNFYKDIQLMVETQKKADRIIQEKLDIPPQPLNLCRGHVKAAELCGCEIFYPEDEEPMVKSPALRDITQVKSFQIPDPPDNPVVVNLLKKAKVFYELTGVKRSIGVFEGPLTTAAFVRGQTAFFTEIMDHPGLCEKLIEKVTEAVIAWKKYHDSEMGIKEEEVGLVDDSACLVSAHIFENMILPYLIKWCESFSAKERHFHMCGDTTHLLEKLSRLNLTWFEIGETVDLRKAKKTLPSTYISRIFDFRLLRDGTKEQILKRLNCDIIIGREGGNFGIQVEGWRGIPLEKVRIIRDTIEQFNGGELPIFERISTIG